MQIENDTPREILQIFYLSYDKFACYGNEFCINKLLFIVRDSRPLYIYSDLLKIKKIRWDKIDVGETVVNVATTIEDGPILTLEEELANIEEMKRLAVIEADKIRLGLNPHDSDDEERENFLILLNNDHNDNKSVATNDNSIATNDNSVTIDVKESIVDGVAVNTIESKNVSKENNIISEENPKIEEKKQEEVVVDEKKLIEEKVEDKTILIYEKATSDIIQEEVK